jgi:hypothetical protein
MQSEKKSRHKTTKRIKKNEDQEKKRVPVFDSETLGTDINPEKLDHEVFVPDKAGIDNSKSHQPYEFRKAGGFCTSGTSGCDASGMQGFQSGLGCSGTQNGSAGYSAGSFGYQINRKRKDL